MKKNSMHKKGVAIAVIVLFIGLAFTSNISGDRKISDQVLYDYDDVDLIGDIDSISTNTFSYDDHVIEKINQNPYANDFIWEPVYLDTPLFDIYELLNDSGQAAWGLTSADFNIDGNIDFAVSHATSPFHYNTITIFYNNGTANFTRDDVYFFTYSYINDIDAGDFDNDGDIDLIFTYSEHQGWVYVYGIVSILYNDGTNTFGNKTMLIKRGSGVPYDPEGRHNPHVASADYDNDGDLDLLVGDNSGKIEFYLNNGTGNFTSAGIVHDFGHLSWGVTSADYDGDGDIDFLVAAGTDDDTHGYIYLKRNQIIPLNFSTCFEPGPGEIIEDLSAESMSTSLSSIDYNNDGDMDFIVGGLDHPCLYINKGKANHFDSFAICWLPRGHNGYPERLRMGGLTSADFDNDGYGDLIVGGVQGYIRLFINKRCLAVITRPSDGMWYKNDVPQYRLFPYNGVLAIGPLSVEAKEIEELDKVEFYINNWLVETDTTSPYSFVWTWRPIQLLRLRHTLRIVAYNDTGDRSSEDAMYPVWKFF